MGGRREVSIISYRPMTRSNLKQERSFFRGCVSTFLQLVVACITMNSFHYGQRMCITHGLLGDSKSYVLYPSHDAL